MRRTFGIFLILLAFAIIFTLIVLTNGLKATLVAFGLVILIGGLLIAGAFLITKE